MAAPDTVPTDALLREKDAVIDELSSALQSTTTELERAVTGATPRRSIIRRGSDVLGRLQQRERARRRRQQESHAARQTRRREMRAQRPRDAAGRFVGDVTLFERADGQMRWVEAPVSEKEGHWEFGEARLATDPYGSPHQVADWIFQPCRSRWLRRKRPHLLVCDAPTRLECVRCKRRARGAVHTEDGRVECWPASQVYAAVAIADAVQGGRVIPQPRPTEHSYRWLRMTAQEKSGLYIADMVPGHVAPLASTIAEALLAETRGGHQ